MVLWIVCVYLALAAIFYTALTATATDVRIASLVPHKWQRARKLKNISLLRRLRIR